MLSISYPWKSLFIGSAKRLHFGIAPSSPLPHGVNSQEKLDNLLLAYPHDAVSLFQWAHEFQRGSTGWTLAGS
jgi:hypothetical protein